MKLVFCGSSIALGALKPAGSLENQEQRYSYLVSKHFGVEENNISVSASSNDTICQNVYNYLAKDTADFFVIEITYSLYLSVVYGEKTIVVNPNIQKGTVGKLFKEFIYSKEFDYDSWYQISRWKVLMLHEYLQFRNIPHMFMFSFEADARYYDNDKSLPQSFRDVTFFKGLHNLYTESWHLTPSDHQKVASEIVIPTIERSLNVSTMG